MGILTSRQHAGVEEVDVGINHAYRYPPKTGCYFGSHFIMGGDRFDTPQPESYLFGENADLNFLGSRPTPFPYPAPQPGEPTRALKALVNIRRESLRFVRAPEDVMSSGSNSEDEKTTKFNIEFTFDADCKCSITIYYFCTEEVTSQRCIYAPRDAHMNSETFHYKRGANQQFSQMNHMFDPSLYTEDELSYSTEKEIIPIAIHCVADEGEEPRQSHTTLAVVDRHSDGTYVIKALKQKLFVEGLCYLLQEIYGIENKNVIGAKMGDDDFEDNGSECVICMSDLRDTLILPCRHLCLCNACADSLRYQASNCPICRAPFRALLQIQALQKIPVGGTAGNNSECPQDSVPPGYESLSLIEALNGPMAPSAPPQMPPLLPSVGAHLPGGVMDGNECDRSRSAPRRSTDKRRSGRGYRRRKSDDGHSSQENVNGEDSTPPCVRRDSVDNSTVNEDRIKLGRKDHVRVINEVSASQKEDESYETHSLLETDIDDVPLPPPDVRSSSLPTPGCLHLSRGGVRTGVPLRSGQSGAADISVPGDDSDSYYSPEDPSNIAVPPVSITKDEPHTDDEAPPIPSTSPPSSTPTDHTTNAGLVPSDSSLPGTPQSLASHMSQRSSGDSFSSSSSTRQLLPQGDVTLLLPAE